ncbi:MAG TPA: hypothetical protein ENK37_10240 [Oceanithermus profundus]|uniref:Uncharacterized protein n=1 Tax=Oceanithermus profundus TaxID=187137 RepID=A0A7C4V767_9DEIN|nr:hypothetical protein [Oceanithermus profundus]
MNATRRVYLWLLGFNAFVVLFAAASALLLPAPRTWPEWMPLAWWGSAAALSAFVGWRWRTRQEQEEPERRVAALSLAALPLIWGLFAVLAFWAGYAPSGWSLLALALASAALGYALQPRA